MYDVPRGPSGNAAARRPLGRNGLTPVCRRSALLIPLCGTILFGMPLLPARAAGGQSPARILQIIDDAPTREIISQPTLRRRFPRIRFPGDRRTYEFLVSHPPLATRLARHLHPALERYTVTEVGDGVYTVEDRGALRGEARLIKTTDGLRVYRFVGEFRSLANMLRFSGRMALVLEYRELQEGGRTYVESDPDLYLRIDHVFFGLMARLLTPLIYLILDRRVNMIVEASRALFEHVAADPAGLYREMAAWNDIRPEDLEAFRRAFAATQSTGER